MKKWKVVGWASIACFCIVAIAIQAVFGGGMGLGIAPKEVEVAPGSTITYDITVYNYQDTPDSFNVFVLPGSCDSGWFSWTTNQINNVPADRGQKRVLLDVIPTKKGNYTFTVRAVSKSDSGIYAFQEAHITVGSNVKPDPWIVLIPDKPEPQYFGFKTVIIINWTACACDPEVEGCKLCYRFWLEGPGTGGDKIIMQDWSTDNTWSWILIVEDIGDSNIYVDAADCDHLNAFQTAVYKNYTIRANRPPVCACLMPDKPAPLQLEEDNEENITWNASAFDPEGDTLEYRFLLSGPGTGHNFTVVQDWRNAPYPNCPTWRWTPVFPNDMGNNYIKVEIRDRQCFPPQDHPNNYSDVNATYPKYWIGPAE